MKILLFEERQEDAWFDLSLRQLRVGVVRFYRVDDLLTGKLLFKICVDREAQKSISDDLFYDIVSLTHVNGEGRVRRDIAQRIEEVPSVIRENFDVKTYEEATGKKLPANYLVT